MHPDYTGEYQVVVTKKPAKLKGAASPAWNRLMQDGFKEHHLNGNPADNFTTITFQMLGKFKTIEKFYQKLNRDDVLPFIDNVVVSYGTWTLNFAAPEFIAQFKESEEAKLMNMYADPQHLLVMHFDSININSLYPLMASNPESQTWKNHCQTIYAHNIIKWDGAEFLENRLKKIVGEPTIKPRRRL